MNMKTMHIVIAGGAFLAGHVVQSKFGLLQKIGNTIGMIPFVGDKLEDIFELLE